MKISPMSFAVPAASSVEARPSIKMQTDATPGPSAPSLDEDLSKNNNIEEKTNEVEAPQPISPQLAALAKQRRALQQERRAFLEEKKALEAQSPSGDSIPIARLKSEPLRVLLESGVTYEQLTEAILANQNNPEIASIKAEMSALKEGMEKKLSERDELAIKQGLAERRRRAQSLVHERGDEFELVRATNALPDVMRLIERTYRETGEDLEVSTALKLVEDELLRRNQKLLNLKKMQNLLPKQAEQIPQAQPRSQGMRTLTNQHTASVPLDRKQRALAAWARSQK